MTWIGLLDALFPLYLTPPVKENSCPALQTHSKGECETHSKGVCVFIVMPLTEVITATDAFSMGDGEERKRVRGGGGA